MVAGRIARTMTTAVRIAKGKAVIHIDECDKYMSALERLPHLARSVTLMWGSPELDGYIGRLMMDSHDGVRIGLPTDVASELLFLAETNKTLRAMDLTNTMQVSLNEAYRLVNDADHAICGNDRWTDSSIANDVYVIGKGDFNPAFQRQLPIATKRKKAKGLLAWLFG